MRQNWFDAEKSTFQQEEPKRFEIGSQNKFKQKQLTYGIREGAWSVPIRMYVSKEDIEK